MRCVHVSSRALPPLSELRDAQTREHGAIFGQHPLILHHRRRPASMHSAIWPPACAAEGASDVPDYRFRPPGQETAQEKPAEVPLRIRVSWSETSHCKTEAERNCTCLDLTRLRGRSVEIQAAKSLLLQTGDAMHWHVCSLSVWESKQHSPQCRRLCAKRPPCATHRLCRGIAVTAK